jgi:hypothetical protein
VSDAVLISKEGPAYISNVTTSLIFIADPKKMKKRYEVVAGSKMD